jgi:hypothetical protein
MTNTRIVLTLAALVSMASGASAQALEQVSTPYRAPGAQQASTPGGIAVAPYNPAQQVPSKWTIEVGDVTLAKAFDRWAAKAGWRIRWDAERHVLISAPATFQGSFEEAVAAALATPGIRKSSYPMEACIYSNTPPLIRITRLGDQASECPAE